MQYRQGKGGLAGILFLLLACLSANATTLRTASDGLPSCESVTDDTVRVTDGHTLKRSDGRLVVLAGIESPFAPTWTAYRTRAARKTLAALLPGGRAHFVYLPQIQDRHGRCLANVYNHHGRWMQEAMVSRGEAYVYPVHARETDIEALLPREAEARREQRGLWSTIPAPMLNTPETVLKNINRFQIVEGTVRSARVLGRNAYLNFGKSFRSDFSILITWPVVKALQSEGIDIETLPGTQVQARGYAYERRGGAMTIWRRSALRLTPPVDEYLRPSVRLGTNK